MRRASVLLVLALVGCPDKDTGDTGEPDSDTREPDTDTDDVDTDAFERCDSGQDDDTDGFSDCADSDCDDACDDAVCVAVALMLPVSRDVTSAVDWTTNSARGDDCAAQPVPHDLVVVELAHNDAVRVTLRGAGQVIPTDACDTAGRCADAVPSGTVFYPDAAGSQVFAIYPEDASAFGYDLERVPWEDCGNRVDDNGDGVVDCDDSTACGASSLCDVVCPEPGPASVTVVSDDLAVEWSDTSQVVAADSCEPADVGSRDVVLAFDAVAGQTLRVDETSGTDVVLNVTQGPGLCSARAADDVCVASTGDSFLEFDVVQDDTYYVIVSADPSDSPIALDLSASLVGPEDCTTLVDDDDDGLAACDDPDCDGVGECALVCDAPPLPVERSGTSWTADMSADTAFSSDGGCTQEQGEDLRFTVHPQAGDVLRVIDQGEVQVVLNVTEGAGACSALLSGNGCVASAEEGSSDGLAVFDMALTPDAPAHVHLSSAVGSDAGDYHLRAGLIAAGTCGLEVGAGGTEDTYQLTGTDFQADWPNDVPQQVGPGCFDPPDGVSDAAFTVSLAHGDTVIVQDVTGRGGIDHVVNILDGHCSVATSCVYGEDDPIGPGLPEIFSFTREDPGSTDRRPYTVQVTTAAPAAEAYNFTVSVLRN